MRKNAVNVLVPHYGLEGPLYFDAPDADQQPVLSYDPDKMTLQVTHEGVSHTFAIFERVTVEISVDNSDMQRRRSVNRQASLGQRQTYNLPCQRLLGRDLTVTMTGFSLSSPPLHPILLSRIVLRLVEPVLPGLSVAASDALNARRKAKRDAVEAAAAATAADSQIATEASAAVTDKNTTQAVAAAATANKKKKSKSKKKGKSASGKPSEDDGQPGAKIPKKQ